MSAAFARLDCIMSHGPIKGDLSWLYEKTVYRRKGENIPRPESSEVKPERAPRIRETLNTAEPVSHCTS